MSCSFSARKVTDRVYWVGAIDWDLQEFHGYATQRGTTYNAYLILAEKVTLIDTVKAPFKQELLRRIASVIEPGKIDYIVSNHSEMDHSGCLPEIIAEVNPEKVFVSKMGAKALNRHFGLTGLTVVNTGDSLDLGGATLHFVETRMLHWPDSMITWLPEEKLLFSQDGFGMHLASDELWVDKGLEPIWLYEAAKYYANILLPFSPLVLKLAEKLAELQWPIEIIAPDHGPLWRNNPGRIIELYGKWATQKPVNRAIVMYDTMWKSTALMARAIGDGLHDAGTAVKLMSLHGQHRSDVVTELLDAGALVVGSPTMNNNIYPTLADALTYLKGLKPANKIGAAFGSYGWSGESVKQIEEYLAAMKIEIAAPGLKVQYVPDTDDLARCYDLGQQVAAKLQDQLATQ